MGIVYQDAIQQLKALVDQTVDDPFKKTFENIHQGYPIETLVRFLKLVDCLNWRIQNEIDSILAVSFLLFFEKPIVPADLYRAIRDAQLIGLSGYSREGLPVLAIGVGLSTFDKASLIAIISTIDDLNYPEKTDTYYIVNVPYIVSACWRVVKPLLQERRSAGASRLRQG